MAIQTVYLRHGPEFIVNTQTEAGQAAPKVAALKDGNAVLAWVDELTRDTRAQIISPTGEKIGEEFVVHETILGAQSDPNITVLANGNFVITWTDGSSDFEGGDTSGGTGSGAAANSANVAIRGQVFSQSGTPIGDEFLVNSTAANSQTQSSVQALPDGRFIVVWNDANGNGGTAHDFDLSGNAIRGRIFDGDGTTTLNEFLVNTTTLNAQVDPNVAALYNKTTGAMSGFVAVWIDATSPTATTGGLRARLFDNNGTPLAIDFQIDTGTSPSAADQPVVVGLTDGRFAVAWREDSDIHAAVFKADGTVSIAEFTVNTTFAAGTQQTPYIIALPDGGFDITWRDANDNAADGSVDAVLSVRYDSTGARVAWVTETGTLSTADRVIPSETLGDQKPPSSAVLANGDILYTWEQGNNFTKPYDTDDESIHAVVHRSYALTQGTGTIAGTDSATTKQRDLLIGGVGVDTLNGNLGDDVLVGGGGGDVLNGGAGNDTASYFTSTVGVTASLLTPAANTGDALGDSYVAIENLTGSAQADTLIGNKLANTLSGEKGNDILIGGLGADSLDGGFGNDTASYASATSRVFASLANGGSLGEAKGDTYYSVENLTGSAFNDFLEGDEGANVLTGGAGNDLLYGGADNLQGDASDADSFDGGIGIDTVSYIRAEEGGVKADLTSTVGSSGDAEGDTFVSIENLDGTSFDDTLRGDGAANILTGGSGDDILEGRGGADRLNGGADSDTASYQSAAAGLTASLTKASLNTGDAQGDIYSSIENLIGSAFADTLVGNGVANVIEGGAGADTLDGKAGIDTVSYASDTTGVTVDLSLTTAQVSAGHASGDILANFENIIGGSGIDTLTGNAGDNVIEGGAGADIIDGGSDGEDTASYEHSNAGVTVNLTTNVNTGGHAAGDILSDIANVIGSEFNDKLTGNADENELEGEDGDDVLAGLGGADTLEGGDGTDTADYTASSAGVTVNLATGKGLGGDAQGDVLKSVENVIGSAFADTLTGNALDNVLEGGAGADILKGGAGIDTASYAHASSGVTANLATGGTLGDAAGDTYNLIENLLGSAHADTLTGNAKNNQITGGLGADTIDGGAGDDVFLFTAPADGSDTIVNFEDGDVVGFDATGFGLSSLLGANLLIGSGVVATNAIRTFLYDTSTGQLKYDADGSGAGAAVTLATIYEDNGITIADDLTAENFQLFGIQFAAGDD